MRSLMFSLAVLAGVSGVAASADAAPMRVSVAPAAEVQTVQYYHGGPGWRHHEWRRREAYERFRRHEWRRAHRYGYGYGYYR